MKRDYRIPSDGWKWTLFGGVPMILIMVLMIIAEGVL